MKFGPLDWQESVGELTAGLQDPSTTTILRFEALTEETQRTYDEDSIV